MCCARAWSKFGARPVGGLHFSVILGSFFTDRYIHSVLCSCLKLTFEAKVKHEFDTVSCSVQSLDCSVFKMDSVDCSVQVVPWRVARHEIACCLLSSVICENGCRNGTSSPVVLLQKGDGKHAHDFVVVTDQSTYMSLRSALLRIISVFAEHAYMCRVL